MENTTSVRMEIAINPQKLIQQVIINNEAIESEIEKGINLAMQDLTDGDNFAQLIREQTKKEITEVIARSINSWRVQAQITEKIQEKLSAKICEYSDDIADKLFTNLK